MERIAGDVEAGHVGIGDLHALFIALRHKDPMPYELVHLADEPLSDAEQSRTRELAQELGW
jgi:hypothetical protein